METRYANKTESLMKDLECSECLLSTLDKYRKAACRDPILGEFFSSLDEICSRREALPSREELLCLLEKEAFGGRRRPLCVQKESPISTNDSACEEDSSKQRGLRFLTGLVREQVAKKPSTFKEVAFKLMNQLIDSEGADRVREEKNISRRVYDAINVLIAARVLTKHGKFVYLRQPSTDSNFKFARERRTQVAEKRDNFRDIMHKYLAIKHLIHRNFNTSTCTSKISLPFLIVSTPDTYSNHVSVTFNRENNDLVVKCRQAADLYGDMDLLLMLDMHSVDYQMTESFVHNKEMLNYCLNTIN